MHTPHFVTGILTGFFINQFPQCNVKLPCSQHLHFGWKDGLGVQYLSHNIEKLEFVQSKPT